MPLRIAIVAGEASGDLLGSTLIRALIKLFPDAKFIGVAGSKMLDAGAETLFPLEKLSVMGITEVLLHAQELLKLRAQVKHFFLDNPPDIYIGVDAPDFNLPIEFALKKAGIKTVHVNSPTLWAWRKKRIHKIAQSVNLMLTLFPFEPPYYEAEKIPVAYIGHPLADQIPLENVAPPSKKYIALLPGSRKGEIKYIGPILLKAAALLLEKYPDCQFDAPMINASRLTQFEQQWKIIAPHLPLSLSIGNSQEVMTSCDVVALASGTATLEALLVKRPMVVLYKSSFISYWIVKKLIYIKHVSLPNILSGEALVPEFIQENATPKNIAAGIEDYLLHPEKIHSLQEKFRAIHQKLKCNAPERAGASIKELLSKQNDR